VIYQVPLEESAPRIAEYCEEAFSVLTRVFKWTPEGKIDVLFVDAFDTHNGWATVLPHKRMAVFAAGSEPGSTIYQPGDYLKRTVYHELTHLLTMDMSYGYSATFSGIFGRVLPFDILSSIIFLLTTPPGVLVPRWVQEGVSVWAETEFTPPGRGRSTFVDMIFRCAVRDNNFMPLDKWYIDIPHWPYGQVVYLYGAKFFQYIYETHPDENVVGNLMHEIAHCALFDIEPAMEEAAGRGMKALANGMRHREGEVQGENLRKLEALPVTEAPRKTGKDVGVYSPIYSDGKIWFLANEEEERATLCAFDPESVAIEKIEAARIMPFFGNLSATRDGRFIYYNRLDIQGGENLWYEIRRFEPASNDDVLVTNEGRYRAIDISPDGRHMAATSQRGGKTYLFELTLDEAGEIAGERKLLELPLHNDVASPRYDPTGQKISFVEGDDEGYSLIVLDRATLSMERVFESETPILAPAWHPVRYTLIFSHDANGVFNLYEKVPDDDRPPQVLTHVTGGLFFPAISQDGDRIAAASFDGFGPHLTIIPYDRERLSGKVLPSIAPPWKSGGIQKLLESGELGDEAAGGVPTARDFTEAEDYNSFGNIDFDFWTLWGMPSRKGVMGGLATSLSDPTGYQDIKLLAGIESRYSTPIAGFSYIYRGLYPEIQVYAAGEQEYYDDLVVQRGTENRYDYAEETARFGLAVTVPLPKLERQIAFQGGYEFRMRNPIDRVNRDYQGLNISAPPTNEDEGSVWAKAIYFDGTAFPRSSSVEDGRWVSAGVERSKDWLGGDIARTRFLSEWKEYISMPWEKNHVLSMYASYGTGNGDRVSQGYFTLGGLGSPVAFMTPGIPTKLRIRGYPDNIQTGESAIMTGISYRFPLHELDEGSEWLFPIYTHQFFGEIYYEGGRTWDQRGGGDDLEWINSIGAEASISLTLFRMLQFAPGLGAAFIPERADRRDSDDRWNVYITFKAWVNF
jgi:hypothetical protein